MNVHIPEDDFRSRPTATPPLRLELDADTRALHAHIQASEAQFDRVAALFGESLDLATTVRRAAELPLRSLATLSILDLCDDDSYIRQAAAFSSVGPVPPVNPYAPGGSALVVRSGKSRILPRVSSTDLLGFVGGHGSRLAVPLTSYLCIPLRIGSRLLGAMTLARSVGPNFREDEIRQAHELAHHVSLLLDHAMAAAKAQESDRRKDEFLATLSHELRNPLSAIMMAVSLLRPNAEPASIQKAAGILGRQGARLVRLVDDLLDVSRITRGKVSLRPTWVELGEVLRGTIESLGPLIQQRRHELTVSMPPNAIPLEADGARLEQVFGNLIGNAARYTRSGGKILVEVSETSTQVVVRVRDNGPGIEREMLAWIFQPFTRVPSADGGDRGLGIGLTLARGIVELHGGSLTAESAGLGRGSEFIVRLPKSEPESVPDRVPLSEAPTSAIHVRLPQRVLLVDDEADVVETTRRWLEGLGHEVRVARDGPEGLSIAVAFQPQVLLIDLCLPGMSGYELASRLRDEPCLAEATFVAVTGYADEVSRRKSLEAGFDRHVTKPLTDEAVLRLLGAA